MGQSPRRAAGFRINGGGRRGKPSAPFAADRRDGHRLIPALVEMDSPECATRTARVLSSDHDGPGHAIFPLAKFVRIRSLCSNGDVAVDLEAPGTQRSQLTPAASPGRIGEKNG